MNAAHDVLEVGDLLSQFVGVQRVAAGLGVAGSGTGAFALHDHRRRAQGAGREPELEFAPSSSDGFGVRLEAGAAQHPAPGPWRHGHCKRAVGCRPGSCPRFGHLHFDAGDRLAVSVQDTAGDSHRNRPQLGGGPGPTARSGHPGGGHSRQRGQSRRYEHDGQSPWRRQAGRGPRGWSEHASPSARALTSRCSCDRAARRSASRCAITPEGHRNGGELRLV